MWRVDTADKKKNVQNVGKQTEKMEWTGMVSVFLNSRYLIGHIWIQSLDLEKYSLIDFIWMVTLLENPKSDLWSQITWILHDQKNEKS